MEVSSDIRVRSMAWRKKVEAKQAIEWYEGYWEIPMSVRAEMKAEEKKYLDGKEYRLFNDKKIDRERCVFHPGMIQFLSGEAQRLQKASNLGARFLNRTFATFNPSRNKGAYDTATNYANNLSLFENPRNCLLIVGSTGTGKTHLAAAIANRLVEVGIVTRFGTFQNHLDKIKAEFDSSGERHYLDDIKGAPLLILDDIGKERQTDWTKSILYDIVNYRYEHLLPTVFTSNLQMVDLANYCGNAVWSRMYEMCDTIEMNGEDYRKNG